MRTMMMKKRKPRKKETTSKRIEMMIIKGSKMKAAVLIEHVLHLLSYLTFRCSSLKYRTRFLSATKHGTPRTKP